MWRTDTRSAGFEVGRALSGRVSRLVAVMLGVAVFTSVLTPASAVAEPQVRTPAECAAALDCRWQVFDAMSMSGRMEFLSQVQATAGRVVPGFDRFQAIRGVTWFFRDERLGARGNWVSVVNAVGLEALERGTALVLGLSGGDYDNPGSRTWAEYLRALRAGELDSRSAHDAAWSRGEQAAIDHAAVVAVSHGAPPTAAEQRFLANSNLVRWAMRNEPTVLDALVGLNVAGVSPTQRLSFYHWLTNVRDEVPWRKSAELSWRISHLDLLGSAVSFSDLFAAYLASLAGNPETQPQLPDVTAGQDAATR